MDNESNLPIGLIMIDVNGLKLTNDVFGHKAGDFVLKSIAKVLKSECRENEIVARVGGDEFIVLIPSTNLIEVNKLIIRLKGAIAKLDSPNTIISASFGFSIKQDISKSIDIVFREAEDNMYRNKISESSCVKSKTVEYILQTLFEKNTPDMNRSKRVSELLEIRNIVLELHEKWDGTGYPKGLKGEEISIEARIINLADYYDAMISGRNYKKQLSKNEAIAEIRKRSGSQFDPFLSEVFVEYLLKEDQKK